jgi:hypothetical protein
MARALHDPRDFPEDSLVVHGVVEIIAMGGAVEIDGQIDVDMDPLPHLTLGFAHPQVGKKNDIVEADMVPGHTRFPR